MTKITHESRHAGLQPLVPYFVSSAVEGLRHPTPPARAHLQLLLLASLLANPCLELELYLHQLMPALLTCALTVGEPSESPAQSRALQAALREHAASVVARLCRHYAQPVYNMTARTASFVLNTLLDPARPLPTQYGCIATLRALGAGVVQVVLMPHAGTLLERYMPALHGGVAQSDAVACRGLLVEAVAQALTAFWVDQRVGVGGVGTRRRRATTEQKNGKEGEENEAQPMERDDVQPIETEAQPAASKAPRGKKGVPKGATKGAAKAGGRGRPGRATRSGATDKAAPSGGKGDKAALGEAAARVQQGKHVDNNSGEGTLAAAYTHVAEELLAQVPSGEPHAVVFL